MNKRFSEKQKYDINYQKSYDDEAQNQREYIAKLIVFFNVIFVLQRELVKIMRKCQITFQCY